MAGLGNLEANFAIFDALPAAARDQMAESLTEIGRAALQLQESLVPRRTGKLASALDVQVALGVLRVRAGLLNVTVNGKAAKRITSANDTFYGVIVEYGRAAGEKVVNVRRKDGTTAPRRVAWGALAPRPFVHVENAIAPQLEALREKFWPAVLARVGEA